MDTRTLTRSALCLLVAALATGCETLRGVRSAPPPPAVANPGGTDFRNPNPADANPSHVLPDGTVVAAGGTGTPLGAGGEDPAPPPAPLPQPRPQSGWPTGVPVPPNAPPAGTHGHGQAAGPAAVDPHLRANPTATGARLNLAPYEVPADRVVELSQYLDAALAQNRDLLARIKELQTTGTTREQALAEAMREIDAITAEAAKTRAALQAQVLALEGKIQQLEEEDIAFLKAVIEGLGKLLPPEPKP